MAIKKRLLSRLREIEHELFHINDIDGSREVLLQRLKKARDFCRAGLPQNMYDFYAESYDVMIATVDEMTEWTSGDWQREMIPLLTEVLQQVIIQTQQETKFKKELFFLPYKASMWDSLESIWRAADEDKEHCIAYVLPIPYCELKPDGMVKEWFCERDQLPEYVSTMDWRSVDLESWQPDAIFIHNPYDNYNTATSVDSSYYSNILKKCTDLLVYVPYFVVGRRWPELHTNLPVYKNMDFMVVQQENMKVAPMQFSKIKENEEPYLADFIPKEKILALGSPKIDRVYYCEKHPQVSEEWLEFIGGRKVIFYNTSITGILQQGERFLNKMRYVFETFQQYQEVALIWRPHPLLEVSLQSVRPELYDEYMKLKKLYMTEKIGIFDTTPDMEMTMAISDAYLGEASSSVVSLFGYTGKPVFFAWDYLLWREPTLVERAALQIGAHIVDKDMKHSYFLAPQFNRFCCMNWTTGEIKTLLDFGNTPDSKSYATFMRDEDDGKFYFSPNSAKTICIYDELTGERRDIPFDMPLEYGNFGGIIKYEHYLYFLPSRYQAMIRLDKHTGELTYYRDCLQEILPTITAEHMQLLGPVAWLKYPNLLYMPALQSNLVMTFDMATGEYSWQAVGPEDTDCCAIVEEKYGSGIFWLFPWRKEKIRRWNTHTGECQVLGREDYPAGYQCQTDWWNYEDQYKFSGVIRIDGYIYLLPCYGNMAMRLNMAEKKLEEVDLGLPFAWTDRKANYFMQQSPVTSVGGLWIPGYRPWNEDLPGRAVQFSYDNCLYWYDFHTLKYTEISCRLTEEQVKSWPTPIGDTFEKMGKDIPYATGEHRTCRSVSQFIEYVVSGRHDRDKQRQAWSELARNIDGTCGEKVKDEILRRLG